MRRRPRCTEGHSCSIPTKLRSGHACASRTKNSPFPKPISTTRGAWRPNRCAQSTGRLTCCQRSSGASDRYRAGRLMRGVVASPPWYCDGSLLQNVLDVWHQWSRCQRFEGKIAALSDSTDEQIAPVAYQAKLIETGYTTADLHPEGE